MLNVLINFLIFFIPSIISENLKPKYHNSSILYPGVQIQNTIGPHEFFIHQISIIESHNAFLFHAIDKEAIYYIYTAEDIEELSLTEQKIMQLMSLNLITQPPLYKGYSMTETIYTESTNLSNKEQPVVIVYCPLDVNCTYFISMVSEIFYDENNMIFQMYLLNNQSFLSYINMSYYFFFIYPERIQRKLLFI